ncbi:Fungal specific transcription factor domain [Geosmithia morbida]|uniref:Fungal specific transcription factor domain n=1 Tax=Geosmithia morbida TaxID=1094350 RepID=A0A9P4YXK6_9HYPO|nr:Fungal specific transcription factor domain [Geosmithia morbida]KAF4124710.1 Fungal specific transcription factor domain [Geosmithia morbida]
MPRSDRTVAARSAREAAAGAAAATISSAGMFGVESGEGVSAGSIPASTASTSGESREGSGGGGGDKGPISHKVKLLPKRSSVRVACGNCRRRRIKCSGSRPSCRQCTNAGEECGYDANEGETVSIAIRRRLDEAEKENDHLRRMVGMLAACDPEVAREVLAHVASAIQSPEGAWDVLLDEGIWSPITGMSDDAAAEEVAAKLADTKMEEDDRSTDPAQQTQGSDRLEWSSPRQVTDKTLPGPTGTVAVDTSSFQHLLPWRTSSRFSLKGRPRIAVTSWQPTVLSLPRRAGEHPSDVDRWTRTGWSRTHVQHLLDVLLTWDVLPFCLVNRDAFLADYHSGSEQFCSSALVHATLALATQLINEGGDNTMSLPSGWIGSRLFADEAESIIRDERPPNSIPNIQAFGMMSFYYLRLGGEDHAQRLADECAARILDLCRQEGDGGDYVFRRVRAITMLSLTTGRPYKSPDITAQEDLLFPDQLSLCGGVADSSFPSRLLEGGFDTDTATTGQPYDVHLIAARLYELTDLVHRFVMSVESGQQSQQEGNPDGMAITADRVKDVYVKCLSWYEGILALLKADGSHTPFVLFVHMYYHFCLLCALKPFINLSLGRKTDVEPYEITTNAAQSVLSLVQSYDDIFTLRRTSALVPYLVCASGLFSLGLEDVGSLMEPVHLPVGDETPLRQRAAGPHEHRSPRYGKPPTGKVARETPPPSHVRVSVSSHAAILLEKMGSTLPAAREAGKLLQREIEASKDVMAG